MEDDDPEDPNKDDDDDNDDDPEQGQRDVAEDPPDDDSVGEVPKKPKAIEVPNPESRKRLPDVDLQGDDAMEAEMTLDQSSLRRVLRYVLGLTAEQVAPLYQEGISDATDLRAVPVADIKTTCGSC